MSVPEPFEPWEEFKPAPAFRHAYLSGIEIAQEQPPTPLFVDAGSGVIKVSP